MANVPSLHILGKDSKQLYHKWTKPVQYDGIISGNDTAAVRDYVLCCGTVSTKKRQLRITMERLRPH